MTAEQPTAFALAGGGTKGAFEAGALAFVVDERGMVPRIVTATSAGAIIAAVISQARSLDQLRTRVAELHHDLLGMTRQDLVFGKQAWFAALDGTALGRLVDRGLIERTRPPVPGVDRRPPGSRAQRPLDRGRRVARLLGAAARSAHRLPAARAGWKSNSSSLLTLDPLGEALRRGGPTGIRPVDPALIARPGLELRLAVTALQAGTLRYVTGDGTIVESDATTPVASPGAGPVDIVEGVLASASVPFLFPPRRLADDDYADGGVLANVPIAAAVRLGARRVVAILAVPLHQRRDRRDFRRVGMGGIFLRTSAEISFAERQRADVATHRPPGVELVAIDPLVDVVGPFEVSPGLMRLDMGYGWLRAADVLWDGPAQDREEGAAATTEAVVARVAAWHLEEEAIGTGRLTAAARAELRHRKQEVADALARRHRLGLPAPAGCSRWWTELEAHDRAPLEWNAADVAAEAPDWPDPVPAGLGRR